MNDKQFRLLFFWLVAGVVSFVVYKWLVKHA